MGENLKLLTCAKLSTKILPVTAWQVIYDTHSHSCSGSEQLGWWSRHWPAACQLRWTDIGLQDADTINQINDHRYIALFFSTLQWLMYSSRSNERTDASELHWITLQTVSPGWVGRRMGWWGWKTVCLAGVFVSVHETQEQGYSTQSCCWFI